MQGIQQENQSHYKIEDIINNNNNLDNNIQNQQNQLQTIIEECIKGMKNQQYFWMWLQFKVVQGEYKDLSANFQQFQKRQSKIQRKEFVKMNADYLSLYNAQYKLICNKMKQLNQYIKTVEPYLDSIKPSKNLLPVEKEVQNDIKKILEEENPELIKKLGTPCFLKLQVLKHIQKQGFGKKNKKVKKIDKEEIKGKVDSHLKNQIAQFIRKLQQIKFI